MKITNKFNAFLCTALMCLVSSNVMAAEIRFNSDSEAGAIGSIITLSIIGTNFPETEGGGANLTFDPNVLQVNTVTIDENVWDIFVSPGTIDNVNGSVNGIVVAAFDNPGANFTVTTIEFQAIGSGVSVLALAENPVNPWGSAGSLVNPLFIDSSITVYNFLLGDGDLAPLGDPDGIINVADYLIAMQIVTGLIDPSQKEVLHGDLYPPNLGDEIVDLSDVILLLGRIQTAP